ncbi:hypothetical protein BCR33DRAFT_650579, partial [Rhizoclosmatium globosum]
MKQHLRNKVKERPFACEVCGLAFGRTKDLQRHASVHDMTNKFACDRCSKTYKRKDGLLRH